MNIKENLEGYQKRLQIVYDDPIHPHENLKVIENWLKVKVGTKVKPSSLNTNYATMTVFSKWCIKPIADLTEEDIADLIYWLNGFSYSPRTIHSYKIIFKKFFKDLGKLGLLELLKEPKPKNDSDKLDRQNLLTEDEVYDHMITAANNNRDKAMIAMLYESGARRGEILACKIKHVDMSSSQGYTLTIPDGKTGKRKIKLVRSKSYVRLWLDSHPQRTKDGRPDPEAWLFIAYNTQKIGNKRTFKQWSANGMYSQLKEIARRSGIDKRANPHSYRHAAASNLAEHLTDQQLKKYLGWSKDSSMASIYVHDPDCDNAILEMNNLEPEETKRKPKATEKVCQNCKRKIEIFADYCPHCGFSPEDAAAERHLIEEEIDLRVEAKFQDKLKELDDRMKAMNEFFNGVLKGKDEKKLKEKAGDVDLWE